MKARIWKDRDTGRWCFDVEGYGLRATGDQATWDDALGNALGDMRWLDTHRGTCWRRWKQRWRA